MKSITKYDITDEQIRTAFIAAGIGAVSEIKEISDGWYNSVYSAVDKDGKKYVMKIAPEKSVKVLTHEQNMMATEVEFYRLINEKTEIKTPQIIYSDFTEKVVPTAYFIMNFLNGERLDKVRLSFGQKEKVKDQRAWILAQLHKLKGVGYGYSQAGLRDNWKDGLTHMTQMLIDDAASFGKKCKVGKKLLAYIDKFSDALTDVPSALVNFDLHAMNLFCEITADGGIQLALLDLERGFWGDPIGDFVMSDGMKDLNKKNIVSRYNRFSQTKITAGREEEIRYGLLLAYLAVIMYVERFSRFKGAAKFFNLVYLLGTLASKLFAKKAFSVLKKL